MRRNIPTMDREPPPLRPTLSRAALFACLVVALGLAGVIIAQIHYRDSGKLGAFFRPAPQSPSHQANPSLSPAPLSTPPTKRTITNPGQIGSGYDSPDPRPAPDETTQPPRPLRVVSTHPAPVPAPSTAIDVPPQPVHPHLAEHTAGSDVFANATMYVDPGTSAAIALQQLEAIANGTDADAANESDADRAAAAADAAAIAKIANVAQARWFDATAAVTSVAAEVHAYVSAAKAADAVPTLVLDALPFSDCGSSQTGAATSASDYASWVRQVSIGLHGAIAAVILEPGAVSTMSCLTGAERASRIAMMQDAVTVLSAETGLGLYLDGGQSHQLSAAALAAVLKQVGVDEVRGFSLNVAGYYSTAEEQAYGETVSALLGGAHYVIDTGRNGNGALPDGPASSCNPGGRALGSLPTALTSAAHADAYLWIKHPGESDGPCGLGDPPKGQWFGPYAVALVNSSAV